MSEGEALRVLRGCGLTETEAKVYLALIRGKGNAKDISVRSKVPYTKIHRVLSSLLEKSLITASSDRPIIYSAKGVGEGLGEYKIRLQRNIEERLGRVEEALMAMQKEPEKSDIWIIRNVDEILGRAYYILGMSRKDVKLALPALPQWLTERLSPVFMRLRAQNVEINVLVTKSISEAEIKRLSEVSRVRKRDKMFGGGLIVDSNEVMLFIGRVEGSMDTAIWANHAGLVQLASAYFDFLWASSEGA